jgi:AcrR family transcriptional regulator
MSTRSNNSRDRILDTAEKLILQQGYAGTSIDDILRDASITKGGFFYHFEGKPDLAKALVYRYLEQDQILFDGLFKQSEELTEDPLQQLLIFLKLLADMMYNLEETHPGCLVASFTYESRQFDQQLKDLMEQGVYSWRTMISSRLEKILEKKTPKLDVSIDHLADMFTSSIEGGIILSRIVGGNECLKEQILAYRTHLRLLFEAV